MKPFIVAFEGPDGAGKTTLLRAVALRLAETGGDVLTAALPTAAVVPWSVLLSGASAGLPASDPAACLPPTPTDCLRHALAQGPLATLLLLLDCARAVEAGRRAPAGAIVLHDRSSISTAVYQGPLECLDLVGAARPDLVILCYASPEVLAVRRAARGDREGERVGLSHYRRAVAAAQARGWLVHGIDTERPLDASVDLVLGRISALRGRP